MPRTRTGSVPGPSGRTAAVGTADVPKILEPSGVNQTIAVRRRPRYRAIIKAALPVAVRTRPTQHGNSCSAV